ncbi:phycoerythrin-associated linker protein [Synechococcus sp. Ace-Pa]|nr:phycoerythrin-associated linker protein [Synechococcus sp. Ace-Pa]
MAEPNESIELAQLLDLNGIAQQAITNPFRMSWRGTSDWDESDVSAGECLLVPVPTDSKSGILLRSIGYTEKIPAIGRYNIDDDGAFTLITPYEGSSAEERIWFATKDVRLRVSMMRTQSGQGIVQASFSSEIRQHDGS